MASENGARTPPPKRDYLLMPADLERIEEESAERLGRKIAEGKAELREGKPAE